MNEVLPILQTVLLAAAVVQMAVAILNLGLVRLMGWRDDLARLPLLAGQVFHVHLWFISVTLAIFGLLTWRFAAQMAAGTDVAAAWLAGCIGGFWTIRPVVQVAYYSPRHWRGSLTRTIVHVGLLIAYGGMAGAYLWAASLLDV